MRRLASAAVFVVAVSAPAVPALMDHSVLSVLGDSPGSAGPCSSDCSVGGAALGNGRANSNGAAQGGHANLTGPGLQSSVSGAIAVVGAPVIAGHEVVTEGGSTTSISGNFTTIPGKGHCTGVTNGECG
jgi:hypothetical protein